MARRRRTAPPSAAVPMCGRFAPGTQDTLFASGLRTEDAALARAIRESVATNVQDEQMRQAVEASAALAGGAAVQDEDMQRALEASGAMADEEEALRLALAVSMMDCEEAPRQQEDAVEASGAGLSEASQENKAGDESPDLLHLAEHRAFEIMADAAQYWFEDDGEDWVLADDHVGGAPTQFSIATPPGSPRDCKGDWEFIR